MSKCMCLIIVLLFREIFSTLSKLTVIREKNYN